MLVQSITLVYLTNFCCNFFRAAALTLRTVLLSLQALLSAAEPDDPQDAVVAKQFKENRKAFNKTAKFWTQYYAEGGGATKHAISTALR